MPNNCRQENIVVLSDEALEKERSKGHPLLVEIGAEWCGTCHIMAPVLAELAAQFKDRVKFARLNIASSEQVAREYGISELPFLLFYRNGEVVDYIVGMASKRAVTCRSDDDVSV